MPVSTSWVARTRRSSPAADLLLERVEAKRRGSLKASRGPQSRVSSRSIVATLPATRLCRSTRATPALLGQMFRPPAQRRDSRLLGLPLCLTTAPILDCEYHAHCRSRRLSCSCWLLQCRLGPINSVQGVSECLAPDRRLPRASAKAVSRLDGEGRHSTQPSN